MATDPVAMSSNIRVHIDENGSLIVTILKFKDVVSISSGNNPVHAQTSGFQALPVGQEFASQGGTLKLSLNLISALPKRR